MWVAGICLCGLELGQWQGSVVEKTQGSDQAPCLGMDF